LEEPPDNPEPSLDILRRFVLPFSKALRSLAYKGADYKDDSPPVLNGVIADALKSVYTTDANSRTRISQLTDRLCITVRHVSFTVEYIAP
jgi:hypothetical protein